jgi:hypothetical protein
MLEVLRLFVLSVYKVLVKSGKMQLQTRLDFPLTY